ncbi:MAG: aminotransferase class IV [Bdellovibrionales bacterium]
MIKKWLSKYNDKTFAFNDRIRLGDGVFDTMLVIVEKDQHTHKTQNILPDLHFARLLQNAKAIGISEIDLPSVEELEKRMIALERKTILKTGRYALNTVITRGIAKRGLAPPDTCTPTIEMRITPCPNTFPDIYAIISRTVKRNEGSPLSQIKSCNYGDNILSLIEAKSKDANEAILLNNKGDVTCASAGNIFCCINDQLVTPPLSDGVMNGITRKLIIEKYNAIERSINETDLKNAAGIYISNSIKGTVPITSLEDETLPKPKLKIDKDFHIQWHSKH